MECRGVNGLEAEVVGLFEGTLVGGRAGLVPIQSHMRALKREEAAKLDVFRQGSVVLMREVNGRVGPKGIETLGEILPESRQSLNLALRKGGPVVVAEHPIKN